MNKISVVLAVRNEEDNIARCLTSVKDIAFEIILVDENSEDKTVEIAKNFGAKVYQEKHHDNFHITKQLAIDKALGDWILQLDADEVVSKELSKEIVQVVNLTDQDILLRKPEDEYKYNLFLKHQRALEARDGKIGENSGEVVAFFIPRRNMFLNEPLIHAGVYPDAVIRLIKRGKAHLPAKSVHEQMHVDGEVSWLFNDLLHYDSPSLTRYLSRLNRYTDLHAQDLENLGVAKNNWQFVNYTIIKPAITFLKLYFRHRGYVDGLRGFLWSMFSSMHFPISYYKYLTR